jgi:chloramphenicol-sensitive protein RarD
MDTRKGLAAAGGAFVLWGLLPVYWKLLLAVPSGEIICHRIVWSCLALVAYLALRGRLREVREALAVPGAKLWLLGSSLLIGVNWWVYIWAVNAGHVIETSLGYYITPLVNALLGAVFFKDRLRPLQLAAVALATAGVAVQVAGYGRVPWIALTLAVTFGLYGLTRKVIRVAPLPLLFLETCYLGLPALGYLVYVGVAGTGAFGQGPVGTDLLLLGAGVVTSLPLVWFAVGAKNLTLTTLGLMQYVAPSLAFFLGVFAFREPFSGMQLVTFGCIWLALVVYTLESLAQMRKLSRVARG